MFERGRATSYSACGIPYWIGGAVAGRGRADRPHARTQHRGSGHRRPDPHRGGRHRPGPRGWSLAGPRRRPARAPSPSTSWCTPPAACRCARRCRASTRPASTACRRSTTARRCAPSWTAAARSGSSSSAAATSAWRWPRRAACAGWTSPSSTAADQPIGTFDPDMGALHRRRGPRRGHRAASSATRWRPSTSAPTAGPARCVTASGRELPADLVVLGLGRAAERARWPQSAGIPLGTTGGHRGRPADARPRSTASGRRATAWSPSHRVSGQRAVHVAARHAREQAGPGRRHQHRRRLRDLPRRHRHRDHQGLRPGGGPHRAVRARRPRPPGSRFVTAAVDSTTRAGYFPGAAADHGQDDRRAAHRAAARRPDRRPGGRGQADRRARRRASGTR